MSTESCLVVEKVAYGMTIGDNKFGNSRPGVVEATLKPGRTLEEALDELDDRLTAWHKRRYPHLYEDGQQPEIVRSFTPQQTGPSVAVIDYGKQDTTAEGLISDIKKTETLAELTPYKLLAGQDKTTYAAYCQRLKELSNGF